MKCYKCAEKGVDSDAIGICIVCGMGVCMDHSEMVEVSFREVNDMDWVPVSGLGLDNTTETKVPRILCDICYERVESKRSLGKEIY